MSAAIVDGQDLDVLALAAPVQLFVFDSQIREVDLIVEVRQVVFCGPGANLIVGAIRVAVVVVAVSRCVQLPSGALRWNIRLDTSLRPDITLAIRMDATNETALDYYLLPRVEVVPGSIRLREENGLSLDAFRFESLNAFFHLTARLPIRGAA